MRITMLKHHELDSSAAGVVKCSVYQLASKGYAVHADCFYTSVPPAEELAIANTGLIGTILTPRKDC
jgi:hypothetical protein